MFQNFDRQGSKINVRFYFNWNEVTTASIAVNCAIVEVPSRVARGNFTLALSENRT
jgi:hypothetical protein